MAILDPNSINPYIRLATPSVISPNIHIRRRVLYDYELLYIESGSFLLQTDTMEKECPADSFLFLRPGMAHSLTTVGSVSQPHIHFDLTYNSRSAVTPISFKHTDEMTPQEKQLIQDDPFLPWSISPLVHFHDHELAVQLLHLVIDTQKTHPLEAKGHLLRLLEMLMADNFPGSFLVAGVKEHTIARQLRDYIDAGHGMHMSLEEFEKQFSYSRYSLEKHFNTAYGTGLIAYRNKKRMELARQYLQIQSVSAVSDLLGFHSIYAFSRAYKNHFGHSPTKHK